MCMMYILPKIRINLPQKITQQPLLGVPIVNRNLRAPHTLPNPHLLAQPGPGLRLRTRPSNPRPLHLQPRRTGQYHNRITKIFEDSRVTDIGGVEQDYVVTVQNMRNYLPQNFWQHYPLDLLTECVQGLSMFV